MKLHLLLFFILAAPVLSRFLSSEGEPATVPAQTTEIVAPKVELKPVNPAIPVKPSSPPAKVAPCSSATQTPASLIFTLM